MEQPDQTVDRGKTYIVGIGASAGGLEAISQLIGHLRPDLPCAYVVLQHLSPSYRSMMVEILGRETSLRVKDATHGELPEAGSIYVVPANNNAVLREGRLHLSLASPEVVPKPSINQFLISLAAEEGESAVGIVLSGTGTDGVAGLRAIQAAGGFTLAQRPDTAKYDGMPRSAIEAGVVDHVLSPEEIAGRLPQLLAFIGPEGPDSEPPQAVLDQLLQRLRERLNFDFSGYKTGTLMRRIRRREVATGNADLASYLAWIETHPEELECLSRDILISVTAFFRDRDAFAVLRKAVAAICAGKQPGSEIRVWVAGCASGEEAYSIAVLFAEALGDRLSQYRIQIFATDIDDEALNVARRGVYPAASMSEIPAELLEAFFKPVNNLYEASKPLRDMIVFARHNLVSDPPFLRLDLVSCRNVLIYFDTPLQAKVLRIFHFGLVKDGYLFLGRSESVAQAEQLFTPQDRRERLFIKAGEDNVLPMALASATALRMPIQRRDRKFEFLLEALVSHFKVTVLLCDPEGNIQHSVGEVDRYLKFPPGTSRLTLGEVVLPEFRGELLSLLHRASKSHMAQHGRRRKHEAQWLQLVVAPIADSAGKLAMVLFVPDPLEADAPVVSSEVDSLSSRELTVNRQIEDELLSTREHLQTLVEEMATANEEMQALNEEAQASNEELQATNEELEAANEELQATNEELVSLNEEFSVKTAELANLADEYSHLFDALQFPILVFDRNGLLQRFNGPAQRQFDLRQTAIGQHIGRLRLGQASEEIERLFGSVLSHAEREEVNFSAAGRSLRLAVYPGMNRQGDTVSLVLTMIDVTDIALANAQLAESQARLAALMANTQIIFAMKDLAGAYLYLNKRYCDFFGIDPGLDYLGKNDFALLPPDVAADFWANDLTALRERRPVTQEHRYERDDSAYYLRSVHQVLFDEHGLPNAIITEAEDVTQQRLAEEQLRITARVFDQAGEAIVVTSPKGVVQTVNAAFSRITGYGAAEIEGKPISTLRSGRQSAEFYASMWATLNESGYWQGEIYNRRKNGEIYPEWLTITRVDDEDGHCQHFVAVFTDISQMKASQKKAEFLATHDSLTHLPNRVLFQDRLRHGLAMARRNNARLALLFIDLDNFKTINDTLGHEIGDGLLKQAANRLREVVRDVDTVARLGGDEFTAILANCSNEMVEQVAHRILDELSASFNIDQRTLFVSASIGIAFFPEDGDDSTTLTQAADAAMYRAKEQGRNCIEFFKPDLQVRLHKRAAIEGALREALRHDRLRLVYQPKYSLRGARRVLVGAEALLRWNDPALGNVPPSEFIPVAESSGLILDLGKQVTRMVITHLSEWKKIDVPTVRIAFNASPRSMRETGYAKQILEALQEAGLNHHDVQVELTEGALLEQTAAVNENLSVFESAGVSIAIDDFGTGYSSLGYLQRLPIDELKIDKSFVDGLGTDKNDEAIARTVLALAKALELRTVAEGVETEEQLAWLSAEGCDQAQGYLLARPMEHDAFEDLLLKELARG